MSSNSHASRRRCPLCGQVTIADYAPFCGKYCRDRDLLTWLDEGYRLADNSPDMSPDKPDKPDENLPSSEES